MLFGSVMFIWNVNSKNSSVNYLKYFLKSSFYLVLRNGVCVGIYRGSKAVKEQLQLVIALDTFLYFINVAMLLFFICHFLFHFVILPLCVPFHFLLLCNFPSCFLAVHTCSASPYLDFSLFSVGTFHVS